MHFEKTIEIEAPQQRVWDALSDLEAWPRRIETVDVVELLTPAPITKGSQVHLKQPKLPEGSWDIRCGMRRPTSSGRRRPSASPASRDLPGRGAGRGPRASHAEPRHARLPHPDRPVLGLTNRYMDLEAEGMKRAAETS
jgi:hypothetical protein